MLILIREVMVSNRHTCDLLVFHRGGEPDSFKGLRQLCVLFIGQDRGLKAFCDCNGSRIRFNFNSLSLGRVFARVFNNSLEVGDIERRGLQAWRQAVLAKYDYGCY
jgi:hypothetical protein